MTAEKENSKPADPFEPFRGMRDAYLDAMSKVMINAVNSEEYAQMSGALLNSTLTMTAPFREALDASMVKALQQLSLPSRQEIAVLAQRFANVEVRLDDMDAKLDRMIELKSADRPAAGAKTAKKGSAGKG